MGRIKLFGAASSNGRNGRFAEVLPRAAERRDRAHAGHSAGVPKFPKADMAPRGAAGGGWRKPDFQSVRGPSLGMPVGNCLLSARKTVMLTMPQAIDSEVPDPEEWMS